VNVSSPNTPGLRELQEKEPLKKILIRLQEVNEELGGRVMEGRRPASVNGQHLTVDRQESTVKCKPILLKIAPDLTNEQLDDIVEIVLETKLDGVVATNTTISRGHLQTSESALQMAGAGGLSGKPLTQRSTAIIRYLHDRSQGKFSIIGVGGIHSSADAIEKLQAGASLVQVYTGFVYEGPAVVNSINKGLLNAS
jgi:dihydroorotate dehydrogenase